MPHSETLLLSNVRAIMPDGVHEGAAWLIANGRLQKFFTDAKAAPQAVDTLDLNGAELVPGAIDLHIHGALGVDVNEADADGLQVISRYLATQGVTGWLPTLVPGPNEEYSRAARAATALMNDLNADGARVWGLHYEGPFVNRQQCGALRVPYFRQFRGAEDLQGLAEVAAIGAVHLTTLAPEIEGGIALIRALRERGWVVSLGHTRAEVATLDAAHAAGASHLTHFMNAMAPLHHRTPGPVGWGLAHETVTCDFIADGIHLHPLILQMLGRLRGASRSVLISDAVAPLGLGDGAFTVWNETIEVAGRRTSNAAGSIAGSVISLNDAVQMMQSLGFTATETAQMSATTPARVLGLAHETGALREGLRADVVARDAAGKVILTMVGGRVVYQQAGSSEKN